MKHLDVLCCWFHFQGISLISQPSLFRPGPTLLIGCALLLVPPLSLNYISNWTVWSWRQYSALSDRLEKLAGGKAAGLNTTKHEPLSKEALIHRVLCRFSCRWNRNLVRMNVPQHNGGVAEISEKLERYVKLTLMSVSRQLASVLARHWLTLLKG